MDYPSAIAIAVPTSTFIVTLGALIRKLMSKDKSGTPAAPVSSVTRQELNGVLNKKFENIVYADRCDAITKGIRNEMKLTRETLVKGIEDIKQEIRSNR